jgi:tetratricopeptide (TPR) repeat protein
MARRDPGASPSAILARAHTGRFILQDFCPLADSIEWELGQRYLQERGNKAFLHDAEPVPFAVNNDGNLSAQAAEVLFASLTAADQAGTLEPDIFVLEVGIGVGLFARYFLDTFRKLCADHGKDYDDRLCYVAGDHSEQMLQDACRHGIFGQHPGRYVLRVVDALHPERDLLQDPVFDTLAPRPFRAVFLNYLLDCLPAAVLQLDGDTVRQLCVRTCLARGAELDAQTRDRFEDLARLVTSSHAQDRRELLDVFGLLASEYDYFPVDPSRVPYGDFAVQFARSHSLGSVLHSYGAIQCLDRLLGLVREGGFILVNDYGPTQVDAAADFQHQRFSHATFVGVNFPLLKAYFGGKENGSWAEPPEDDATSVHARLLGHDLAPETVTCFRASFGCETMNRRQAPVQLARTCLQQGRFEAALTAYAAALEEQPYNWVLMNEVAHFLTYPLRNPAAGLELARAGLACNPACSADLWNALGDALFSLERVEEASQAFRRAVRINPNDVRARYKLACVCQRQQDLPAALGLIAAGLGLDNAGTFRQGFLQKQAEILSQVEQHHQVERQFLANRISHRPARPRTEPAPSMAATGLDRQAAAAGKLVFPADAPQATLMPSSDSAFVAEASQAAYMTAGSGSK